VARAILVHTTLGVKEIDVELDRVKDAAAMERVR
jgi:hypothetical protein